MRTANRLQSRGLEALLVLAVVSAVPSVFAQETHPTARFEVASIKRHADDAPGGGIRTMPDGTFIMTNQPISSIILGASPTAVRDVEGLPAWAATERYDIIAKPQPGATRSQQSEMMANLLAERLKVVGHVEELQRTGYSLVVDHPGRLGPQLMPATLNCLAPVPSDAPAAGAKNRCGMEMTADTIASSGVLMSVLALSLENLVGGLVNDKTGLKGFYALTLQFSRRRALEPTAASSDDRPDVFTALREQLGLRLQQDKLLVPTFVLDHIERPSEN